MSNQYKKYAVVENNVIVNTIVCDVGTTGDNLISFDDLPDQLIGVGWRSVDGKWEPPSRDIQSEWYVVRMTRDQLLVDSDVNVLPDRWMMMAPEKQQEWTTYRQLLRDIPEAYSDPREVIWPVKPR